MFYERNKKPAKQPKINITTEEENKRNHDDMIESRVFSA